MMIYKAIDCLIYVMHGHIMHEDKLLENIVHETLVNPHGITERAHTLLSSHDITHPLITHARLSDVTYPLLSDMSC